MSGDIDPLDLPEDEFLEFVRSQSEQAQDQSVDESIEEDDSDEVIEDSGESEEETSEVQEESTEEDSDESEETDSEDEPSTEEKASTDESEQDYYKRAYDQIFQPFKANGREIKVDSAEEVIRLMQMGANYTKKMQSIKPYMRVGKALEEAGLLQDQEQLNYLLDLSKKDPKAIAKLISEAKLDPLDIDTSISNEYRPKSHVLSDKEFEVQEMLDGLKETPTGNQTIEIINKWDSSSQKQFIDKPALAFQLNEHVSNGTYEKVMAQVDKMRMLGELSDVSDLEAYYQIGSQMFSTKEPSTESKVQETKPEPKVETKPKVDVKEHLAKRKLASNPRGKAPTNYAEIDPWSLSEEEFDKMFNKLKV